MKSLKDTYELYNGVKIPCIGFGTWQTPDGEVAVSSVKEAIAAGYRHIDTAAGYNNEESVGVAITESGVNREELFITTKLHNNDHGYEATLAAFELSMKKLGLDYLDLYLIHWPNPIKFRDNWKEANAGSWKAFEELYKAGKIRAIGVSNFMPHHMDALLETAEIKPMVNQIRLCPGETQEAAASYCKANSIQLEAYSPLGTGRVFEVKEMQDLSQKYNKSIAQICVRWSLQMGYLPLPKSVTPERIRENGDVFDFELSPEDVALIAGLTECCGPTRDPDTANF
jgi:diketogulonate reductase-like aldo/keto reductase